MRASSPITLSHNVATEPEVDEILRWPRRSGPRRAPAEHREWGGYTGYFADPDGFRWEIATNPGDVGQLVLP